MSKYKEHRRQQIERERKQQVIRRWFVAAAAVLILAAGAAIWHRNRFAPPAIAISPKPPTEEKWTLATLLALKHHQLEGLDIGQVNLLCAEGLRGAENLDVNKALDRLDEMANRVRLETNRNMRQFLTKPGEFRNSEGYFRMCVLATVLQQDFGIRYNPDRSSPVGEGEPDEKFFADSHDLFVHGLTGEMRSGTCSSLPVLYAAIGRRLNYPLSLVTAKNHLFVRWENPEARFNIEATAVGLVAYDDEHYRKWPNPMALGEERDMGYLQSMTATEELACFLSTRGHCLQAADRFDEALAAFEQATHVTPDSQYYGFQLHMAKREEATRTGRYIPGIGMPPDPTLMNDPPELAWGLWHVEEDLRRRGLLPTPGYLKKRGKGRLVEVSNSALPQSPPKR